MSSFNDVVMDIIMFPVNLRSTSGLSILLHDVISLTDATSYDKSANCMGDIFKISQILNFRNSFFLNLHDANKNE